MLLNRPAFLLHLARKFNQFANVLSIYIYKYIITVDKAIRVFFSSRYNNTELQL